MVETKAKGRGKAFQEYLSQKQEYRLGNRPKDVLQKFIEEEMDEHCRNKAHDALWYDTLIQKFSDSVAVSKRKKKTQSLYEL